MRRIVFVALLILSLIEYSYAQSTNEINGSPIKKFTEPACSLATKHFASFGIIMGRAIASLHQVFPIKIGGLQITPSFGNEDFTEGSSFPICYCGWRVGLKIQFWEPLAIGEATMLPMCFPTFGVQLPFPGVVGTSNIGQQETSTGATSDVQMDLNSYQAHYIKYPLFMILNIFTDLTCIELSGFDIGYFTEIDPTWQNDMWATLLFPESYLVSNFLAQLACIPDAVTAQFGKPLDPLFWCMGSWGSVYPVSQNTSHTTNVTASAATIAKLIMKLHREGLLWGTYGSGQGVCKKLPMPIWRKSQYNMFPLWPKMRAKRQPIGRSDLIWGYGLDIPGVNHHVWAYAIYSKRFCCLL
jgi:conjugal transfer pilus assembly protein TraU